MKVHAQIPTKIITDKIKKLNGTVSMILGDQFGRRPWESQTFGVWKVGWEDFIEHLRKENRLKEFYIELLKRESTS